MRFAKVISFLAALMLMPVFSYARVYLVSVGVADYPGLSRDLKLSSNDAKDVASLYLKNSDTKCIRLLDKEATVAAITTAMNRLYSQAKFEDKMVFFFSGHGCPDGFIAYDGVLDYNKISEAMSGSRCPCKMIFADACFSGMFRNESTDKKKAVTLYSRKSEVMLFLSSRSGEISFERPEMKNGFFTSALLSGLKGGADADRDRKIIAKELYDFVRKRVIKMTSGSQHPVMWGNFPDGMIIMKW